MEDFHALAAALGAGIADVRGCLILSSDGLVLGANPDTAEADARPARIKLAALGEPERGFLQFGTEVWCYVRRGPYAALVVTGTRVRPGLVIDQMEQVLLTAEEARSHRDALRVDTAFAPPPPTTRPRTPLHPEPKPVAEPANVLGTPLEEAVVHILSSEPVPPTGGLGDVPTPPRDEPVPTPGTTDGAADGPEQRPDAPPHGPEDVDRFSLAREFSRLLQDDQAPADG
jgi:hypothetical protein